MTREDPVDHDVAGKISGGSYGQLSDVGSVAEREGRATTTSRVAPSRLDAS